METKNITLRLVFTSLLFTLLCIFTLMPANADDDQKPCSPMMDGMGSGYMGYGRMGSGHMGMGSGNMRHGGMGMMNRGYMHMLDLSESQLKSMREIQKSTRSQLFELQDKLGEYSDKLYTLYKDEKPNPKSIGAIYKRIFGIKR